MKIVLKESCKSKDQWYQVHLKPAFLFSQFKKKLFYSGCIKTV